MTAPASFVRSVWRRGHAKYLRIQRTLVSRWYWVLIALTLSREERSCVVCGNQNLKPYPVEDKHQLRITFASCAVCGLVAQQPMLRSAYVDVFYRRDYYRGLYWGTHRSPKEDTEKRRATARERIDHLVMKGVLKRDARVLDFGSGVGVFGEEAERLVPGLQVVGIDPGTSLTNTLKEEDRFTAIVSFHVLEHLYNPVETLRNLLPQLSDDGRLFIEVPDLALLRGVVDFHVAHLFYFSQATLRRLIETAGYEVIEQGTFPARRAQYLLAKKKV